MKTRVQLLGAHSGTSRMSICFGPGIGPKQREDGENETESTESFDTAEPCVCQEQPPKDLKNCISQLLHPLLSVLPLLRSGQGAYRDPLHCAAIILREEFPDAIGHGVAGARDMQ